MAPHQMMERKAFERRLFAEHRINLHEADLGHIVKTFGDEHGRVNWEAFAAALGHNNAVSKNARRDAGGFVWQELPSTLRTQRWEPAKLERKIADKLVQRMAGGATGYTHQRCYILLAGTRTEWEGDGAWDPRQRARARAPVFACHSPSLSSPSLLRRFCHAQTSAAGARRPS